MAKWLLYAGLWIKLLGLECWPGVIALCSWAIHSTLTVSLHPGVQMGTGEFTTGGNPVMD